MLGKKITSGMKRDAAEFGSGVSERETTTSSAHCTDPDAGRMDKRARYSDKFLF